MQVRWIVADPMVNAGAASAWALPWLQGEVVGELRARKPSKARPLGFTKL